MPFVTVNNEQMILFGYNIPAEKQFGFKMLTAILLMLPARTLHLAIVKLGEMQRKKKQEELWQRKMISEQRKRDTSIGY